MLLFYSIIYFILLPVLVLRLLIKGIQTPDYRRNLWQRFALFGQPKIIQNNPDAPCIWLHAVSLGEVIAAQPYLTQLFNQFPDTNICITSTTPTGSARVKKLYGEKVFHVYTPFDLPGILDWFYKKIKPDLILVMETELWPNMINKANQRGIPIALINARLSERSAHGYLRFSRLTQRMMNGLALICCQEEADAKRFLRLGITKDKLMVTGSSKYDIHVDEPLSDNAHHFFSPWKDAVIWIAASTHLGEDEKMLDWHSELLAEGISSRLILVPRHPERFDQVADLLTKRRIKFVRRTDKNVNLAESEVLLGDPMGELLFFMAAVDVAFIGGSLIKRGGHNPLEACIFGKPFVSGPHVFNFESMYQYLIAAKAGFLADETDCYHKLKKLLSDKQLCLSMGNNAKQALDNKRGASAKVIEKVGRLVNFE